MLLLCAKNILTPVFKLSICTLLKSGTGHREKRKYCPQNVQCKLSVGELN